MKAMLVQYPALLATQFDKCYKIEHTWSQYVTMFTICDHVCSIFNTLAQYSIFNTFSQFYTHSILNISIVNIEIFNISIFNISIFNISIFNITIFNISIFNISIFNISILNINY